MFIFLLSIFKHTCLRSYMYLGHAWHCMCTCTLIVALSFLYSYMPKSVGTSSGWPVLALCTWYIFPLHTYRCRESHDENYLSLYVEEKKTLHYDIRRTNLYSLALALLLVQQREDHFELGEGSGRSILRIENSQENCHI